MGRPLCAALYQSPMRLVMMLLLAIAMAQYVIMAVSDAIMPSAVSGWLVAVLDPILLSLLLAPVLIHMLFRPITSQIQELERAEVSLRAMRDGLEIRVQERTLELEQRNREISLLAEMSGLLQTCSSLPEAQEVISRTGPQLFPGTVGALYVYHASRNDLEAIATWGEPVVAPAEKAFVPAQCWALRRGRVHSYQPAGSGLSCGHLPPDLAATSLCVPMIAQGEVLGVLHLRRPAGAGPGEEPILVNERLAVTLAESIALALINFKLRETLLHQSIRDPLTGLFNRRYLEETLERELRRAQRRQSPLSVVMLDVDHFKRFNDTHGHEAGDLVLREVGALLAAHTRESDVACRYGGEEFALVLPDMPPDVVGDRIESIRLAIKQLAVRHRYEILERITVSAGIAGFPEQGATGGLLLRAADGALYQAKADGRDRVVAAGRQVATAPHPVGHSGTEGA